MQDKPLGRPSWAPHGQTLLRSALLALVLVGIAGAQSIISGDITGTVKDPTGAVLSGAAVAVKNTNTGITKASTTNGSGQYRFSLLQPGNYTITVTAPGFQSGSQTGINVVAGQPTTANFQLSVAQATTTVDVSEAAAVVQSENADLSTVFNSQQIENVPNPGGDLTFIAQTAPGVTMNTQAGYGNFSALGTPGTSNVFMVNGQNFNDPFLGLNNSGASNLMLGFNDIAESNVITSAYSAQYGQYAGAQVNYTTKAGSNAFHGNAIYYWDGRATNANEFFNNSGGNARPFLNFNQWATDVNGPIWRNHTFFDVDYEGARVVLPTQSTLVNVPSPAFQAATLANLGSNGNAAEIPFYQKIFAIQNAAPGAKSATPVEGGGCGKVTALGPGAPCVLSFRTVPPNKLREYLWSARVDHNFSDKDRGYIRVYRDNGYQPTFTDYFNPIFNAYSVQPQMSVQISENHTFGPNTVNQFNGSAFFGAAPFEPSNLSAALQALPTVVTPSGGFLSAIGGENYAFPQGRRNFQYQIIDDFSRIMGKHTVRLGFSWLHVTDTDLGFSEYVNGRISPASIVEFFNGGGPRSSITQRFPTATEEGFNFDTFGGYISDDWKATDRLTLSLNLRLESYSNPTCKTDCFSRLNSTFTGAPVNPAAPYNQAIVSGQRNAFADTQTLVWEPRIGIAWTPTASGKTVIRAGGGIFADELPGSLVESVARNVPGLNSFTIHGNQTASGFGAFAPGVPNSLFTAAAQANQVLRSQFASGGTLASIQQSYPGFVPPNFVNTPSFFKQPTYYKWNFEIQQAFGSKMLLSVNYAGTHGIYVPVDDNGLNAYCDPTAAKTPCPNGFAGVPSAAPDPRFGTVTQYISAGTSTYNGLIVSLQRRLSSALTWNLNYTWSHALDDVSNGGFEPFNFSTNTSILSPQNPHDIRANYGNADEDVRHYISMGFMMNDLVRHAGFHHGPARIFGGWTLSGNIFYRTGLPFTVIDSNATANLNNYGGTLFATPIAGVNTSCGRSAVDSPCFGSSDFVSTGVAFGNQGRNSFRGPGFFDMDLALMKDIAITERVTFSFGAQAFNVLNHPNFDQPVGDLGSNQFGSITTSVGTPTSILGAFVGGGNAPRFVEIKGVLRF